MSVVSGSGGRLQSVTFSLTLTILLGVAETLTCLTLGGGELAADVQQAGDDRVDREVADSARRQLERGPADGAGTGAPRALLGQVRVEAGGAERVDGTRKDAGIGQHIAADRTLDQLAVHELHQSALTLTVHQLRTHTHTPHRYRDVNEAKHHDVKVEAKA